MTIEIISPSLLGLKGIAKFRTMLAGQADDAADIDIETQRVRLVAFTI